MVMDIGRFCLEDNVKRVFWVIRLYIAKYFISLMKMRKRSKTGELSMPFVMIFWVCHNGFVFLLIFFF